MNTALLLAGGTGSRISMKMPKQYARVCGRMMITYPLETLLENPLIDSVFIAAECDWRKEILEDAGRAGLALEKISGFVTPGRNRQESIWNGLRDFLAQKNGSAEGDADMADDSDTVLIHDAARPFLSAELIEACYRALDGHDGVMPVLPMKDTVYLSRDGLSVDRLLERSCIYAGQAPELFLLKKYYLANRALVPDRILEIHGSTEPAVMAGLDIVMIPGEEVNFKVTTEADFYRFRECMEKMRR